MLEKVPDGYAAGNRYVERMFCARLWNLQADVALIYNFLINAFGLVAEDQRIFATLLRGKVLKLDAAFHLFEAAECVAESLEFVDTPGCRLVIGPSDRIFCAERCLVDFGRGRGGADAAKCYSLYGEGVACAENRTYIIKAPHIVEHDCKPHFWQAFVMLDVNAVEVADSLFLHGKKSKKA